MCCRSNTTHAPLSALALLSPACSCSLSFFCLFCHFLFVFIYLVLLIFLLPLYSVKLHTKKPEHTLANDQPSISGTHRSNRAPVCVCVRVCAVFTYTHTLRLRGVLFIWITCLPTSPTELASPPHMSAPPGEDLRE